MSIILAFSGGLDTSFCVPYLKETYDTPVHTVTVDTGGLRPGDAEAIVQRAEDLGAASHSLVDGKAALYEDHLSYLIQGNVKRGGVYPLCVGPERVVQARVMVQAAAELGATAIAHGSTGAGNDQVRFDVATQILSRAMLGKELDVLAPVRSLGLTREASTAYLEERGFDVPSSTTDYSINRGLWGTTVGGAETLTTHGPLPDSAYPDTTAPKDAPDEPLTLKISFEKGLPVAVNGEAMDGVSLVEHLNEVGGQHGVGRDIHVGDTILGIKGRVGFEAPAAEILITAHRELEKLVLSKWQQVKKDELAQFYGMLLHEAQYFDPVMRDIEAHLTSSQETVDGTVTLELYKGVARVLGADSSNSLFNASLATYGEENALWDGRDAEGFTRLAGVQSLLAAEVHSSSTSPSGGDGALAPLAKAEPR
ncbi:argininosuccinate synthase [Longibacter salinarum]|uniref:argininosuccinate synthase n=1 Tax=Longibacter salinarum TaxID=1850348 RepID=A0A2A8D0F5_9BACT|nr:argininosuccinate synthase [Longibacter salinarum]PEN14416.1 argininosuccinate synthase [Longibacter salinarum]